MEACGYGELRFDFPKWPHGVAISRRRGRVIERWFAGVHESVFAKNKLEHVLGAYAPKDWWTVCSRFREARCAVVPGDAFSMEAVV